MTHDHTQLQNTAVSRFTFKPPEVGVVEEVATGTCTRVPALLKYYVDSVQRS